ncbi:hypothetical protein JCM8097_008545 [Rhodosporidiobolus ruineniae]
MFFDETDPKANAHYKARLLFLLSPNEQRNKLTRLRLSGHERAAAQGFAQRAYLEHKEKNGPPENHKVAKELFAGIAGAMVDRLVETKGLDFIDREKAKREAQKHAEAAVRPDRF